MNTRQSTVVLLLICTFFLFLFLLPLSLCSGHGGLFIETEFDRHFSPPIFWDNQIDMPGGLQPFKIGYKLQSMRPCIKALSKAAMSNVRINTKGQTHSHNNNNSIKCTHNRIEEVKGVDTNKLLTQSLMLCCCLLCLIAGLLSIQHIIENPNKSQTGNWIEFFMVSHVLLYMLRDSTGTWR